MDFGEKYEKRLTGIHEIISVGEHYIGYDKNGNELFAWRHDAVNIEYFKPNEYSPVKIIEDSLSLPF